MRMPEEVYGQQADLMGKIQNHLFSKKISLNDIACVTITEVKNEGPYTHKATIVFK